MAKPKVVVETVSREALDDLENIKKRTRKLQSLHSSIDKQISDESERLLKDQEDYNYQISMLKLNMRAIEDEIKEASSFFTKVISQLHNIARRNNLDHVSRTIENIDAEHRATRSWVIKRTKELMNK